MPLSTNLSGLDDVSISSPVNGQILKYNSTSGKWENSNDLINLPSNFMTLGTTQQTSAAKAIFGTDYAFGSVSTQKNLLAVISDNNSTSGNWVGKMTVGAKNKTFIMGAYGDMCALGAHSWTDAQAGTGSAWEDIYINPDGNKSVFIGGSPMNGNETLMKISNVGSGTTGTVKINRSTNLSNNFKDVACWDDSLSHFNNDAGYITSMDYSFAAQYISTSNYSTNINFSDATKRGFVFMRYSGTTSEISLTITCNNYFDNYIYLYNNNSYGGEESFININDVHGPNNSRVSIFCPTDSSLHTFRVPYQTGILICVSITDFGSTFRSNYSYQYGAIITHEPTYLDVSQFTSTYMH